MSEEKLSCSKTALQSCSKFQHFQAKEFRQFNFKPKHLALQNKHHQVKRTWTVETARPWNILLFLLLLVCLKWKPKPTKSCTFYKVEAFTSHERALKAHMPPIKEEFKQEHPTFQINCWWEMKTAERLHFPFKIKISDSGLSSVTSKQLQELVMWKQLSYSKYNPIR